MESFEWPEVTNECKDVSNQRLAEKIFTTKILNKTVIANILLATWKTRAVVTITPWKENTYLFRFEDLVDRKRVLEEAPWSVIGRLLFLQPLQTGMAADEMEFC
ncbi:hypothetical protein ACSBR1_039457 [Camellia fascicularis]